MVGDEIGLREELAEPTDPAFAHEGSRDGARVGASGAVGCGWLGGKWQGLTLRLGAGLA